MLAQAGQALELAPTDPNALLLAAQLASNEAAVSREQGAGSTGQGAGSTGQGAGNVAYDKARGYAKRLIDSAPTIAAGYMAMMQIESRAGNRKAAIDWLETGKEKTESRDKSLLWELARLRIEAGDLKEGQDIVETLGKFPADDRFEPLIGYLEAQIELAEKHWQAAIKRLEELAPQLIHSPDLLKQVRLQIAVSYEKMGNTNLQLAAYRQAVEIDPLWPPARLGVASTLLALNKFDEALEEFRYLGKLDGMADAAAVGEARSLILRNLSRGRADQDSKQNWNEVDGLLDQLALKNPDAVGVTLLRAESLSGQQQTAKAESLLLEARAKSPDRVELWTALAGLYNQHQQWPKAEQLLDDAQHKFGDQVWIRLARGSYLLVRASRERGAEGKEQRAGSGEHGAGSGAPANTASSLKPQASSLSHLSAELNALSEKTDAFSPIDRMVLARGLASLSLEAGDTARAIVLARRACDADPKNLQARLFLFDLAFRNTDATGAEQVLTEIGKLEGEGPFWHYGQAALCLLKSRSAALDEAAFQHLDAARKQRPGWSALALLTAQIQDRQGQSGAALQNYLEAIDLGEQNPLAIRRATELLYSKQRYSEADQLLRRVERQPNLFTGEVERIASKVYARLDDVDRALDHARGAAANSKDWQDQVWLGQLLNLIGQQARSHGKADEAKNRFDEAEKSLRHGIELKPEIAEPWVALIRFYVAIGRKADAETAIHQAEGKLSANSAALALAACYEAIGESDEASKRYQLALSQSANDPTVLQHAAEFELQFGKPADAEAHLRKIVSGQVPAKPDEVASARRTLAAVLRSSGSYPKIQESLALIEQNLATGSAPEDVRAKAFALANCPQPERHREAIGILEKLLTSQPAADDLRMALVQLYLAEKDWPKASKLLRTLISNHEQNPRYLAIYVSQLLERGETDEANLWIRRLEQIAPDDFATAGLKAESQIQAGEIDSAIRTFHDSLARKGLSKADAISQTRIAAVRLEELASRMTGPNQAAGAAKLFAESEGMFRKLAKVQPDEQLLLAIFLCPARPIRRIARRCRIGAAEGRSDGICQSLCRVDGQIARFGGSESAIGKDIARGDRSTRRCDRAAGCAGRSSHSAGAFRRCRGDLPRCSRKRAV